MIAGVAWGICAVFGVFGLTVENAIWLWAFVALCAFSPTIASYVVLKRNNEVKGFKEWLKNVFNVKTPLRNYLLIVILIAVCYVPLIIESGFDSAQPFYLLVPVFLGCLIGGGIEEAGWRYILQPELDKKFGLAVSSLVTGAIWAAWHIPVFLSQGRIESLPWLGLFAVGCLCMSFAYGAIVRITKNVFMSVLFHTLSNTATVMFYLSDSSFGFALSNGLLVIVSVAIVFVYEKRQRTQNTA